MVTRVPPSEWRWLRALLVLGTFTVGLVLLGLIANVALYFSDILLILILSWLFAFILSPIVSRILRVFPALPRLAVVVGVYAAVFIVVVALLLLLAATLADSIGGFIKNLPSLQSQLPQLLDPWQKRLDSLGFKVNLQDTAKQALDSLQSFAATLVGPLTGLAGATLGFIGNLFIVVFLSLFILIDKDRMVTFVNRLVPPRWSEEANLFEASVSSAFGGFLRGQAIQGLLYGVIAGAGSTVLGLEYMPVTTAAVAILQMVPFFGPFFSWAPPVIAALLTKQDATLPIFIVMAIGWFVVMNIVAPRVMASSVGIHPVVVLISVLIGLKVQGVVGAIFAIPVAAVISTFFFYYLNRTQTSPKDVTTRAVKRVEAREGRRVRVPAPPPIVPESAVATGNAGGPVPANVSSPAPGGPAASGPESGM
jgi:predicted PurR-regulated permease PerM